MEIKTSLKKEVITSIQKWIEDNIDNKLSMEIVSKRSGYSKWHIQRMFKSVTGLTIGAYIRRCRLKRAAETLIMTEKKVIDISYDFYFDSPQSFCRVFKSTYGVTPLQFRRLNKNWC